jgi:hypothetical protein
MMLQFYIKSDTSLDNDDDDDDDNNDDVGLKTANFGRKSSVK